MARTTLAKTTALGPYGADGVVAVFTAADVSNMNQFVFTGRELIIARNVHATDAATVTLTSAANARGRSKNITAESIAAGVYRTFGPFKQKAGWAQSDGYFYLNASAADIEFCIVVLP